MSREIALLLLSYAGRILCLLAAGYILYSIRRRVRDGGFSLYGTRVQREKNPATFWAVVVVGAVGAVWFAYIGLR